MEKRKLVGLCLISILLILSTYTALQTPDPSNPPAVTVDDLLLYPTKYKGKDVWFTDTITQKTEQHGKTIYYFKGDRVEDRLKVIFNTSTPGQKQQDVSIKGRLHNSVFYGKAIKTVNTQILTFRRTISILALIPLLYFFLQSYTINLKTITIQPREDNA